MTLYEKLREASRQSLQEGIQKGLQQGRQEGLQEGMEKGRLVENHFNIVCYVQKLISKGTVFTEAEACELLDYDFNEYLAAKKEVAESEI